MSDKFVYTIEFLKKLNAVREQREDIFSLLTESEAFEMTEWMADFDMAVKAVGKNYRKMKEYLNNEHKGN